MTLATSAMTTFTAIGNREDLIDTIYKIDPTDTPFVSGVDKEKASAVNHEWQTQALASAATNAQLEGDDLATSGGDAATVTVRRGNIAQISRKVPIVTETQRIVDHAGRDDELSYQTMLKGLELKRDMEFIVTAGTGVKTSGSGTVARLLAPLLSWVKTNSAVGTGGTFPGAADGANTRTDGTQRGFTENLLKSVLSATWISGGKPDTVMVGAFNKQAFSLFTGRSSPQELAATKKITAAVTVYESDFGSLKVIANRFSRSRDAWVLQMDLWALAYLRQFQETDLAKTGDFSRRLLLSEYTLVARNEAGSGIVADLSTS